MLRSLRDGCFVGQDGVYGANRDAAEGGDGLAVELLEAKEHVGFVHRLEVEVGAEDAVAVEDRPAHVSADHWRVRGLDGSCGDWSGWEAIEAADDEVDQVGRGDTG